MRWFLAARSSQDGRAAENDFVKNVATDARLISHRVRQHGGDAVGAAPQAVEISPSARRGPRRPRGGSPRRRGSSRRARARARRVESKCSGMTGAPQRGGWAVAASAAALACPVPAAPQRALGGRGGPGAPAPPPRRRRATARGAALDLPCARAPPTAGELRAVGAAAAAARERPEATAARPFAVSSTRPKDLPTIEPMCSFKS